MKSPHSPFRRCRPPLSLVATIALSAPGLAPVFAHHGQEFLVVQDASVPSMWSGTVFGGIEWSRDGSDDELTQEPGVMLGLGSRLAVGTTLGFAGSENDWYYESVSPFAQFQITPPTWPVRVALMAGYHFADDSVAASAASPAATFTPAPAAPVVERVAPPVIVAPPPDPDPDPDPPCGPAYGPDAPPCPEPAPVAPGRKLRHAGHVTPEPPPTTPVAKPAPTSNTTSTASAKKQTARPPAATKPYDGIHRHAEDHAYARLIIEADLTSHDKLIFNLIGLWPERGSPAWGYAAGYRHSFSHALAAGVEAIGDFGDANEHELILGGYFSPTHHLSLKLGAGIGLTDASPDVSLRTGVVWRF